MDELSNKNYVVIDDFLANAPYGQIKQFLSSRHSHFTQAGIGALDQNVINKEIRGDSTYWLSRQRDTELTSFWELVDDMIHVFNRYCFLSLGGYEFHLTRYSPGAYYAKHLDQFQNRNNRIISVVIYLNESWQAGDGGELELYDAENQSILINPLACRCVLFKSDTVPHSVLRCNRDRYSLTGWLLHKPSALGQFLG